jgi:hypothetical protein
MGRPALEGAGIFLAHPAASVYRERLHPVHNTPE